MSIEDFNFEEPKVKKVTIRGVECEILDGIPYDLAAKIADGWMASAFDQQSGKDINLRDTMDDILLSIFVKPKLTKEFLKSNKCPSEFAGLAVSYYSKIVAGFGLLDDGEYTEDFVDVEDDQ